MRILQLLVAWFRYTFDPKWNELKSIEVELRKYENRWHRVDTCTENGIVIIKSSDDDRGSVIL